MNINTMSGTPRTTVVYTPAAPRASRDRESLATAPSMPSATARASDASASFRVSAKPERMNG